MTMTTVETNPMHSFRAPVGIAHPHLDGNYLNTQREHVSNDTGAFNIYPGTFRYIPDPSLEVDFAIWEDMPDPKSRANFFNMSVREHYEICKSDEWEVADVIASQVWKPIDGVLAFAFGSGRLVLCWRTGEEAEAAQGRKSAQIAKVDQTFKDTQAELGEKYAALGGSVQASVEDDDGPVSQPTLETAKSRKRR